jgi:adenosylmethionine-8-amino-7-oxononanoate aminotransferase
MIDGVASMWCNVWGHSNPELVRAITNQSKKLQQMDLKLTLGDPAIVG